MTNIFPPPSRPDRQSGEPWTAGTLAAELMWLQWLDDWWNQFNQERMLALEEALVSRKARRKLRRELRESAHRFAWAGDEFAWQRLEDVHNQWLVRLRGDDDRQAAA